MRRLLVPLLLATLPCLAARRPGTIAIPMRDGAALAADLYRAAGDAPAPAVVIHTPYNKNGFRVVFARDQPDDALLASDAYAFVVVDWRGRHASRAAGAMGRLGEDGYDLVEWVGAQPWCDGKVGMWGASALAQAQYRTAEQRPPHLACGVPLVPRGSYAYESFYPGGVLRLELVDTLDLLGFGMKQRIVEHPTEDAFWRTAARVSWRPDQIAAPLLLIGGWYDINLTATLSDFADLRRRGDPVARDGHRLLIGPWSHSAVDRREQGELEFAAAEGVAGRAALAWCDRWLRGIEQTDRPPIEYYQMGEEAWHGADRWPTPGDEQVWYLQADRTLTPEPPGFDGGTVDWSYDPADPAPTLGGQVLRPGVPVGPRDQNALLERRDVVAFTTPPLGEATALRGPMRVDLAATVEQSETTLAARLCHVDAGGRSILISDGIRRVSHRHGSAQPAPLVIGEVAEVTVDLSDTAYTVPAGDRLRLVLSVANAPRFEPPAAPDRVQIWCDERHASALRVTVAR